MAHAHKEQFLNSSPIADSDAIGVFANPIELHSCGRIEDFLSDDISDSVRHSSFDVLLVLHVRKQIDVFLFPKYVKGNPDFLFHIRNHVEFHESVCYDKTYLLEYGSVKTNLLFLLYLLLLYVPVGVGARKKHLWGIRYNLIYLLAGLTRLRLAAPA